jgi:hypothetical protein
MSMINDNELSQREMTVAYTIENIINGLKYIGNEIDVQSPVWETFRRRIETIDSNVDRIIQMIEKRKEQSK